MSCYIKTVHFRLKYNGLAIVRKTTKLIELGGHHGLQNYGHLCYYFYVFLRFFKIQKVVTFYVFLPCFVRFLELWSTPRDRAPTQYTVAGLQEWNNIPDVIRHSSSPATSKRSLKTRF